MPESNAGWPRGCCRTGGLDFAALGHDRAVLEDVARPGEHGLGVRMRLVDDDVGGRAGAEMAAVCEPEDAGRCRTRHDGDLVQRVFARDVLRSEDRRGGIGMDAGQPLVAEAAVHQQPDEVRIARERAAVGMVGGEEHAPGIPHQQEQLQPDRPLQRIDEIPVAVPERHDAAARVAFDVHHHPLARAGEPRVAMLQHGVARGGDGLAEHDLADIDRDVGRAIDGSRRCAARRTRTCARPRCA